ncbi:ubiquitin-binding ESCRT-I subunit protein STP22 [Sugiyamaella lignohabitans]|uniref:Ubiquitin-binding ESCRT-I subunit protein STP22 n=1 Tax=Sugiyamaella lignohabitans TaxID=796027 RepID=A0A167FR73_9ASCO|nr:ubiquitin-binding ESCRT-I subunit protein STP22 [Sugiyamaella lignohabitans]ANB15598.1 ubiquitin-binding ESCRT-I subunit protein STP22 [Sugiyamaella lignohabitans]
MIIHPGNYVDTNGRCYHPYLTYWLDNIATSSLTGFAKVLSEAFSKEPPVYAASPIGLPEVLSGSNQHQAARPQPPPLPPNPTHHDRPVQAGLESGPFRPPPPLPPLAATTGHNRTQSPGYQPPNTIQSPRQQQDYRSNSYSSFQSPVSQTAQSPLPPPPPPPPPPPTSNQYQYQYQQIQTQQHPFQHQQVLQHGPQVGPSHLASQSYNSAFHQGRASPYSSPPPPVHKTEVKQVLDIMDSAIDSPGTPSLASNSANSQASSVPVPVKPPNPEKLAALQHLSDQLNSVVDTILKPEIDTDEQAIFQTKELLNWFDNAVTNEKRGLEHIISASKQNMPVLRERIEQAKRVIQEAKSRPDPKIDDILCAENIVFNQLYDVVCDDLAIEDTLYVLDKALDNGRVKLDTYLKHIRSLAREQFMKRALSNKIGSVAQLSGA